MKKIIQTRYIHHALCLGLEKLEACRELANSYHSLGLEDIAGDFLLEADKTRQEIAILASWLHAILWAQGKIDTPAPEQHHTVADFERALASVERLPALLAKQGY